MPEQVRNAIKYCPLFFLIIFLIILLTIYPFYSAAGGSVRIYVHPSPGYCEPNETVTLEVIVVNEDLEPYSNVSLNITINNQAFLDDEPKTDGNGRYVTTFTAPNRFGEYEIIVTATINGETFYGRGGIEVGLWEYVVNVNLNPSWCKPCEKITFEVRVGDENRTPIPNISLNITMDGKKFLTDENPVTDEYGWYNTTFTAPFVCGEYNVTTRVIINGTTYSKYSVLTVSLFPYIPKPLGLQKSTILYIIACIAICAIILGVLFLFYKRRKK